jgi:diacylglycerol kinase (ATP)
MDEARGPVVLVVSPHAGSARCADPEQALRKAGVEVGLKIAVSALDATRPQGAAWKSAGFTAAVAAGGDGTVGAVASHVAGSGLPLGILPLGTANDVARSLQIPLEPDDACSVIAHGTAQAIDIGFVRPGQTEPGGLDALAEAQSAGVSTPETQRIAQVAGLGAYFVHALTLGLNVEFARLATDVARRERLGALTYVASAIEAVTHFHPVPIQVRLEGVVAGAYGMRIAPEARVEGPSGLTVSRTDETRTIAGEVVQLAAVITPVFGGSRNLRLPDVNMRDRLIDFVILEALNMQRLRETLEKLSALHARPVKGPSGGVGLQQEITNLDLPGLWRFKARGAYFEQPGGLDVTLDGEVRARTPLEVRVEADGLSVLLPAQKEEEDSSG